MRCRPTDATSFPATDHLHVLMTPGWHTRIAKLTRNSRAPNASTVWRIANPALRPLFSPPMIHYRETTFVEIIWEITLPRFARHPSRLLEETGRRCTLPPAPRSDASDGPLGSAVRVHSASRQSPSVF